MTEYAAGPGPFFEVMFFSESAKPPTNAVYSPGAHSVAYLLTDVTIHLHQVILRWSGNFQRIHIDDPVFW